MEKLKGKLVTLTKVVDLEFGQNHPNGINPGYTVSDVVVMEPKIGFGFMLGNFITSPIEEIEDYAENTYMVHTLNSMYKLEIIELPKKEE